MPLAVVSARYTKHLQTKGRWWKTHAILNTFTVIFVTIGRLIPPHMAQPNQLTFDAITVTVFTLGYYAVGTSGNNFNNVHHRIGLTIFVAILLQFFFGFINALVLSKPHIRTPLQNRFHIVFGNVIFISSVPYDLLI